MIRETTYSGARRNLAALMDQVTDTREPVWIRRRGKESVALISAEDLSSLMETDYLLRSVGRASIVSKSSSPVRSSPTKLRTSSSTAARWEKMSL